MEASDGAYVRICEFHARAGLEDEFERIYGPEGEWVQLFRQSRAFLRTELNRDLELKGRYLTVDYFVSEAAYLEFVQEFCAEYDALERRSEAVRASENAIGSFINYGGWKPVTAF
jgi:hypothetical protein